MSVKTAGVGHFTIPTAPAAGTSCTSGAANVFTTTYVQLIASTAAALYITGIYVEEAAVTAGTYIVVQLATGGAGSETIVGQYLIAPVTGSTVTRAYRPIFPPIPVANATRIACKTADSVGAQAKLITLECIAQSNVVDDGIAVGTVTTVTNQLTAAQIATGVWQDATAGDFTTASSIGKSLYTTGAAPGAAGGLQIAGSNAATTYATLTVTGAMTLTGNVALADGLTIAAPSTLNRAGLDIAGNGTGAGIKTTGGATGVGFSIIGGATSGDGIKITTTSGHGINSAPVGSSMHGFLSTGGNAGTSDGIKAAAGTGGVDFRANQTGNLTGNVSGSVGSVTGAVGSVTGAVGSVTAAVTVGTNNDKTGYGLSAAAVQAIWDALTTALTTVGSIGKRLADNIDALISTRAPSSTAVSNADYTAARAAKLDNLDVAVSTRGTGDATAASQATINTNVLARAVPGDAMTLTAAERNSTADALLARNVAGGSSIGRNVAQSLAFLRNKWTVIGDTLTVYDTDDTTVLWTATVARAAGDPVSSSDPA